jgi:hypothetical protein
VLDTLKAHGESPIVEELDRTLQELKRLAAG